MKLLDDFRALDFNDTNVRELPVLLMEIKLKAAEYFPDNSKLNRFINLLIEREYKDYLAELDRYLSNDIDLNEMKSIFTTLRVVVHGDLAKHLR